MIKSAPVGSVRNQDLLIRNETFQAALHDRIVEAKAGTIVIEKDGRYRVRIRRKVRGVIIDKSARFERLTDARKWDQQTEAEITAGKFFKTVEAE